MYKEKEVVKYLENNKPKGANQIADYFGWSSKAKDKNRDYLKSLEERGAIIKVKGDKIGRAHV